MDERGTEVESKHVQLHSNQCGSFIVMMSLCTEMPSVPLEYQRNSRHSHHPQPELH